MAFRRKRRGSFRRRVKPRRTRRSRVRAPRIGFRM